jgi:hypothetical protein
MTDEQSIIATVATAAQLSGKQVNAPCEEGATLGKEIARLTDLEMAKRKQNFPNHVERCATCAFRLGTAANACAPTLMDAMKCVIEGRDQFVCHERENHQCVGYAILKRDNDRGPECPWPFSNSH